MAGCVRGIYQAPSIKVAEAAKVIENTQRDLNIGFVNELSKIFNAWALTPMTFSGAGTKWNFNALNLALSAAIVLALTLLSHQQSVKIGCDPKIILSGQRNK